MIDYFRTILTAQYEASLCMLERCVRRCPAKHWKGKVGKGTFRQVAYHTLYFTDLYLSLGNKDLERRDFHCRGGSRRIGADPDGGLTQVETLEYLGVCRRKAVEKTAAETMESLQGSSGFSKLRFSRGELHLYNIRHIQHHTGQMNAFLRRVADDGKGWWVKSGWR